MDTPVYILNDTNFLLSNRIYISETTNNIIQLPTFVGVQNNIMSSDDTNNKFILETLPTDKNIITFKSVVTTLYISTDSNTDDPRYTFDRQIQPSPSNDPSVWFILKDEDIINNTKRFSFQSMDNESMFLNISLQLDPIGNGFPVILSSIKSIYQISPIAF
uniref:Uncharacterized protein n=1 Tax=Pithovirus LCPAC102 TaxID=2506587 RepID=A0A4D5XFB3_9VIRU|nr:MAG: hypothetical protein LCPAC102_01950 [Pithovirus LCPAC102]